MVQGFCNSKLCHLDFENGSSANRTLPHCETSLVYLDDIIIVGRTPEEHLRNIRKVLEKIKMANLKLNPPNATCFAMKCFLRHVFTEDMRTDPEKISAVAIWNRPNDVHHL